MRITRLSFGIAVGGFSFGINLPTCVRGGPGGLVDGPVARQNDEKYERLTKGSVPGKYSGHQLQACALGTWITRLGEHVARHITTAVAAVVRANFTGRPLRRRLPFADAHTHEQRQLHRLDRDAQMVGASTMVPFPLAAAAAAAS